MAVKHSTRRPSRPVFTPAITEQQAEMDETREEPNDLWMHDTVKSCIGRAIAIINRAGQCEDKDLLPGTLAAACSTAIDELFAARDALDKHWTARKPQEVAHG